MRTLNKNRSAIGKIIFDSENPMTVTQIQKTLYEKEIKRQERGEEIPSGEWNYHEVQYDCSNLLGLKFATMTRTKEYFDEHGFGAKPPPYYFMTPEQKLRFAEILARGGKLEIQASIEEAPVKCPKCGCPVWVNK